MSHEDQYTVVVGKRAAPQEQAVFQQAEPVKTQQPQPQQPRKKGSILMDIAKFAIVAFMVVTPFRLYVAQPFIVSGSSMEPTFEPDEYLVVDQLSYRFDTPQRGDVIIFKYPLDTSSFFIKRIIGLPGESVEIVEGAVYVYDAEGQRHEALVEPYRNDMEQRPTSKIVELADDEYYVMGDNRDVSSDSRVWGPLREKYIVGRALARLLPVQQVQLFPGKYTFGNQDVQP